MGNIYAWHSATQCDKLLDSVMALLPLTDMAPSNGVDELHKYNNVHTHSMHTHMHVDAKQHTREHEVYTSEHDYVSCSSSTPGFMAISAEDLDCLPMLTEDMFFLTQSLPDMEFASDEWSLPAHESLSSPKAEGGEVHFEIQDIDTHVNHDDQHFRHDEHQPILDDTLCADAAESVATQINWCNGNNIEDLLTDQGNTTATHASPPLPNEVFDKISTSHKVESSPPRMKSKRRTLKRQKSVKNMQQPIESSDISDGMEDEESDKLVGNGKARGSKNLVSERKRRMKLNEKLYSLRAIVPKISKMDKASIVADAISHVQDLQQRKKSMEDDLLALQVNDDAAQDGGLSSCVLEGIDKQCISEDLPQHKIIELDVWNMGPKTYNLRIHCKKGPGVLVQFTKALEALNFEIVNANLSTISDHFLNAVIVKVDSDEVLRQEDVKDMMAQIFPAFGLHF